jgi:hypothetical protein
MRAAEERGDLAVAFLPRGDLASPPGLPGRHPAACSAALRVLRGTLPGRPGGPPKNAETSLRPSFREGIGRHRVVCLAGIPPLAPRGSASSAAPYRAGQEGRRRTRRVRCGLPFARRSGVTAWCAWPASRRLLRGAPRPPRHLAGPARRAAEERGELAAALLPRGDRASPPGLPGRHPAACSAALRVLRGPLPGRVCWEPRNGADRRGGCCGAVARKGTAGQHRDLPGEYSTAYSASSAAPCRAGQVRGRRRTRRARCGPPSPRGSGVTAWPAWPASRRLLRGPLCPPRPLAGPGLLGAAEWRRPARRMLWCCGSEGDRRPAP